MMRFSTLLKHPADWMVGEGTDTSVVVTSRVRLARNLAESPFPGWSKKNQRQEILKVIQPQVEALPIMKDGFSSELINLEMLQKQVMVERHLISREQAARGEGSGAVLNRKQSISLMINEEDHLRMQSIRPGLQLDEAYQLIADVDQSLEKDLVFAFDPDWGYVTACPTNLGTGMRASVMLHLPGLVLSDQIGQVLKGVDKMGFAVRGIYGEGTESLGNLFQISNQSTLGESEEQILRQLSKVIKNVAVYEDDARLKLMEDDPAMVEDQFGRAYGILRHVHLITSKEALNFLSMLRLGVDMGHFPVELHSVCDSLMMEIQPAHLQWRAGTAIEPEDRDMLRAEIIRQQLQNLPPPLEYQKKNNEPQQAESDNETNSDDE